MPVIVVYEKGADTRLLKHDRLETLINNKGEPKYNKDQKAWMFVDVYFETPLSGGPTQDRSPVR